MFQNKWTTYNNLYNKVQKDVGEWQRPDPPPHIQVQPESEQRVLECNCTEYSLSHFFYAEATPQFQGVQPPPR